MTDLELLLSLLEKAETGNLSLDAFYQTWPENLVGIELYDLIFDDIESSIEHFPGKAFGVDPIAYFNSTKEYKILKTDKAIILLLITIKDIPIDVLLSFRRQALS